MLDGILSFLNFLETPVNPVSYFSFMLIRLDSKVIGFVSDPELFDDLIFRYICSLQLLVKIFWVGESLRAVEEFVDLPKLLVIYFCIFVVHEYPEDAGEGRLLTLENAVA